MSSGLAPGLFSSLRDQVLVPARRESGVGVDQEVVLLAGVELLNLGARPAVAEAGIVRILADAEARIVVEAVQVLAIVRLPADAEGEAVGMDGVGETRNRS